MASEVVVINISIMWTRLRNAQGQPYSWGGGKNATVDKNWSKQSVIYRWVKSSTKEIADIGETERRLSERVNNYIPASPNSSAGPKNKKVFNEEQKLMKTNDHLYLEFVDDVPGYDLTNDRERKLAESLLIGYYRPYLFNGG